MDVSQFVKAQKFQAPVASDGARQHVVVGGLGEFVDQRRAGHVADSPAGLTGGDAGPDEQVAFAGASRDSDRLQQLRAVLPCEVRVTSVTHPLFGRLLAASGFKRRGGVLLLVVVLPDGSPGTIRADATDILGDPPPVGATVMSVEGFRRLHELVVVLASPPGRSPSRSRARK
jgi:hypothetical protein